MAEGIIFTIGQKLAFVISHETNFLSGVEDQAQMLCSEINLMSSALRDTNEKDRKRNEVKEWQKQIRDAVMEAEDVIDIFIYGVERQRHRNVLTRSIFYPNQLYHLHKFGMEVEKCNKKISRLSARRSSLGIATSEAGQSSVFGMISNEQSLSFRRRDRVVEEFFRIEFKQEEDEIAKKLPTPIKFAKPCRTVVSIVARNVYKRKDVEQHFQTREWISISQKYQKRDLFLKKELDVEKLISRIKSHLKETTYLIVFDELWSPEDWNTLKLALPVQGEDYQSRVLITTRNEAIARHADPFTDPYLHRLLNEEESWKLFLTKVLSSKDAGCPGDLEDLGRKIVQKCHGLPITILVMGGLLSTKDKTRSAWSKTQPNIHWELNQNDSEGSCKQVLNLSYANLPDHLKPCFFYLGFFPEDIEIEHYRLIWLWIAEGFIQPRESLTIEDVAEDHFKQLIQRGMMQVSKKTYDGRVKCVRINDFIRDLAISEARHERFLEVVGSANLLSPHIFRWLSIIESTAGMQSSPPTDALNQGTTCTKSSPVLDLRGTILGSIKSSFLKQIGKLILLNYLSIRDTDIEKLPSSLGDLQNLETLDLLMKLQQLRNLVFYGTPKSFDYSLEHMTKLQTLSLFQGKWIETSLDRLANLTKLCIRSNGSLTPYKEALLNGIPKLLQLQTLVLMSDEKAVVLPASFSEHLELCYMMLKGITGIQVFPSNLTMLELSLLRGQRVDELMATLENLSKLSCLILNRACLGSKVTFSTDGFPQLEKLVLIGLDDLEEFTVEEGALSDLRTLRIDRCDGLKRLPFGLKQVITLQELTVVSMSEVLSSRIQKDVGEDWEIINHIPKIEITSDPNPFPLCSYDQHEWF
ncbi:hypothetical protein NE237_028037 [Protea cynaroides]|uniref:Uncharacterized protein n=1 Tax=Protea cynaroides TaxID=273540 RepID=A0A9Q0GRM1_9MAGN|nr:hypothetical protein NE237_028037 [Protea cynaroides]